MPSSSGDVAPGATAGKRRLIEPGSTIPDDSCVPSPAGEIDRANRSMRIPGLPAAVPSCPTWCATRSAGASRLKLRRADDQHARRIANAAVSSTCASGSYRYDQVRDGGIARQRQGGRVLRVCRTARSMVTGDGALRHGLWRLTDARYREAVRGAAGQEGPHELTYRRTPTGTCVAFERRKPVVDLAAGRGLSGSGSQSHWPDYVERARRLDSSVIHEIKDGPTSSSRQITSAASSSSSDRQGSRPDPVSGPSGRSTATCGCCPPRGDRVPLD